MNDGALSPAQVRLSKRMSRVLRHAPDSVGLTLDAHGWVPLTDLTAALKVTREQVDAVVAGNDKARFAVRTGPDGVPRIRASQGHSRTVPVDLALPPADPPPVLFHGTAVRNLAAIAADGLRPGRRHHVHLSADEPTAQRVGRRHSPDVAVLRVAAARMAAAGHVFHHSDNDVWLTAHVPPEFVTRH